VPFMAILPSSLQLPRRPQSNGNWFPNSRGLIDGALLRLFDAVDLLESLVRWSHTLHVVEMAGLSVVTIALLF